MVLQRHTRGPTVLVTQRGGDKSTHPCLAACARFFIEALVPDPVTASRVHLRLVLCGPWALGKDTAGLVRMPDTPNAEPRDFTIMLDRRHVLPIQVETLAHECIHVQQFITGRLAYTRDGVLWDGVHAGPLHGLYQADDLPPWEADAWGREAGLAASAWPTIDRHLRAANQ